MESVRSGHLIKTIINFNLYIIWLIQNLFSLDKNFKYNIFIPPVCYETITDHYFCRYDIY